MYEHDNNVVTTNKAFYTQADYQISDTVYVHIKLFVIREDDRNTRLKLAVADRNFGRRWMVAPAFAGATER